MEKLLILLLLMVGVLLLVACTDVGYYTRCAVGHFDVLRRCRPIEELLADARIPPERRARLEQIRAARDFASRELGLPDNGSYRKFADLGRPYVVWNVVAAPEFSLEPKRWCFPVAGCVSYRGYFDEDAARREAGRLAIAGYDVDVYGVEAYSTLNWFDDPVLNTFIDGQALNGPALMFHELAHQVVYVSDDSRFNEAFAVTVEREGVRRWMQANGNASEWERYCDSEARNAEFLALLHNTRQRLTDLYAGALPIHEKRSAKQAILADLSREALALQQHWGGDGITRWLARGVNNARLASLATYRDLAPAFQSLLADNGGNLSAFYAAVRDLGKLPAAERLARLSPLLPQRQSQLGN